MPEDKPDMGPASTKKPKAQKCVTVWARVKSVPYIQSEQAYVLDIDVDDDQTVAVVDFTETWPEESGVITYVVTDG